MIDTGSTYNIISLKTLLTYVFSKNPFEKTNPSHKETDTPCLLLGDGRTTVKILGKVSLRLTFTTISGSQFSHSEPFCVLDHPVPSIILGHRFFLFNPGFDLSYQTRALNLREFQIPWTSHPGSSKTLSNFAILTNTLHIPARTTLIVDILIQN